jgi:TatD DNase family protein
MKNSIWIDSHCHLADPRLKDSLTDELSTLKTENIGILVSSALSRDEMEWHLNVLPETSFSKEVNILTSAGTHPHYEESREDDLNLLIELAEAGKLSAVGEIGFDKRNEDISRQKKILLNQLDLAREFNLPVVIHVVKMYYELHKLLKDNFPRIRGYLHGFNSSLEVAESFSRFDLAFSLNDRLPDEKTINYILKRGFILLETDAPYARPTSEKDDFNHLKNLKMNVDKVCSQTGISLDQLQNLQFRSFLNIFPGAI